MERCCTTVHWSHSAHERSGGSSDAIRGIIIFSCTKFVANNVYAFFHYHDLFQSRVQFYLHVGRCGVCYCTKIPLPLTSLYSDRL